VFDFVLLRWSESDGGYNRLTVEEIGAAGIRNQSARNSAMEGFRFSAKQGVKVARL
jgi:hypothetical protein